MTKTVLAMLFGALVASGWWATGIFGGGEDGFLPVMSTFLSIGAAFWIAYETSTTIW